jgi:hypothetical protein
MNGRITNRRICNQGAFARTEIIVCALCSLLLGTTAMSIWAENRVQSERAICLNNLRQVGRALQIWASDHNDNMPWRVSWQAEGGTAGHLLAPNLYFQFSWISNHLGSPKLLVCPSDGRAQRVAENWGPGNPGGFLNPGYRNNALSYPLFVHAVSSAPDSLLSGDPNIQFTYLGVGCSYVPGPQFAQLSLNAPTTEWTNAVHVTAGHLLLSDGSVRFTSSSELRTMINRTAGSGTLHAFTK